MLILIDTLLVLLSSFAMPLGYVIGMYTEKEVRPIAERIRMENIFSFPFLIFEIILLALVLYYRINSYEIVLSVVMLVNLIFMGLKSTIRYDFVRTVEYQLLFHSGNLLALLIIFLI